MKRKKGNRGVRTTRSPIAYSVVRIMVRRWHHAKNPLGGSEPNFSLSLHQVLEGSGELAQEQLSQHQKSRRDKLLCELKAFSKSCKNRPKDVRIEMLVVGNKGNGSFRLVHPGEIGRLGSEAAHNLARHFPKHRKSRSM